MTEQAIREILAQMLENHELELTPVHTPPQEYESVQEATAKIMELVREAELYGRLHEIIEGFRNGTISVEQYSKRHSEITDRISALRQQKGE